MRFCNLKAFGRIEGILPACFIRDVNTPALIKEILCSLRRRARLKAERLHKMSIPERVNGEGHYCLRKTEGGKADDNRKSRTTEFSSATQQAARCGIAANFYMVRLVIRPLPPHCSQGAG
jgi:hypothetical protein